MADLRRLSINTATVRKQGNLLAIIDSCNRLGIGAISPWRDQVGAVGIDKVQNAVAASGLRLSGYCRAGMLVADTAHKTEVIDDNRRAIEEACILGAPCLVVVVGGLPQFSRPGSEPSKNLPSARAQVEDVLHELLETARNVGMKLALEPLHPMYAADRACLNTIDQALGLCLRLDPGAETLGIAIDAYHVWWDPNLLESISRAKGRIFAYHVCDWLVPTTDMLNDRGMMGDGVIDLRSLTNAVENAGYRGLIEAEIFSHRWWARPMEDVLRACQARVSDCV